MKPTKKRKFSMYGMSFNNVNKAGPLTKQFIKFIKSCEKYGCKATKRGFYKIMGRELYPGNNSTFFSAIRASGIVTLNTEWNGDRLFSLPLFPEMKELDVDDVIETIKEILK